MRAQRFSGGYKEETYRDQLAGVKPRLLMGAGPEPREKFDSQTKKPTGEIESMRIYVYYPGLGVQTVKLPENFKLPRGVEDLAEVDLISPEACVVNGNIYVRAQGLK